MKNLGKEFRKLLKPGFYRDVLTLVSGTAIAQIIPLTVAPVLTRIYTPQEFGRLALYVSIVQILSTVSSGRYELAIVLPREKENGIRLTIISIAITIFTSVAALLGVILFSADIANLLGDPKLRTWLYLVPASTLLIGLFNALNYYNTREKNYGDISRAKVYKSFGGSLSQLLFGLLKLTSAGLIIGHFLSHFFGNIKMARRFLIEKDVILRTDRQHLKNLAKQYIDFPKFSVWGVFLNALSLNVANFFVSTFYGLGAVGFYSHAYRYLALPASLIGNSIGQVYFQKISTKTGHGDEAVAAFVQTLKRLVLVGGLIFIPIYFFVEDVFALVFGEEWRIAGIFAQILSPLLFIRFVFAPLSLTNIAFEKQKLALGCQILIMVVHLMILWATWYWQLSIETMLWSQTVGLGAIYLFLLFVLSKVANGKL